MEDTKNDELGKFLQINNARSFNEVLHILDYEIPELNVQSQVIYT